VFRKENGKFIVPVQYKKDGTPKRYGVSFENIGIYEAYVPLGKLIYASDDGLGSMLSKNKYNLTSNLSSKKRDAP
jgi:hypothetical protein